MHVCCVESHYQFICVFSQVEMMFSGSRYRYMFSEQMKGLWRWETSLIQTDMCYINIMAYAAEIYANTAAPAPAAGPGHPATPAYHGTPGAAP